MLINLRDKNGKLVIKDILDIDFNMCGRRSRRICGSDKQHL